MDGQEGTVIQHVNYIVRDLAFDLLTHTSQILKEVAF